ncbi:hypothetical protein J6590_047305 [Homalodisca vitripennis]|nr:hypothetical protein J6590_047305 [Homalodisca vitripennis]
MGRGVKETFTTFEYNYSDFPITDVSNVKTMKRVSCGPSSCLTFFGCLQTDMSPDSRSQVCDSVRFQKLH